MVEIIFLTSLVSKARKLQYELVSYSSSAGRMQIIQVAIAGVIGYGGTSAGFV